MKKHFIFDLDGTLIDSAPSILQSFAFAFASLGIHPTRPLSSEIIGPPLMQTLSTLSGTQDALLIQQLAVQFKAHYDSEACKNAIVYPEIADLLTALKQQDYDLYIATNKRYFPTTKILQHLDWMSYFTGVYALDFYTPAVTTKALLIKRILSDLKLNLDECVYIGDRYEDGLAAEANNLDFVMVTWGYADEAGSSQKNETWEKCQQVEKLKGLFNFTI